MSVIYLVRHAQANTFGEDYDQLSALGVEQAHILGRSLGERVGRPSAVVTGTQRRHKDTGAHCLKAMGLALELRTMAAFDEYDHAEVIARDEPRYRDRAAIAADLVAAEDPRRRLQEVFMRAVVRWTSGLYDGDYRESWPQFRARCLDGWRAVMAGVGRSETVIVFTSGGPISVIMAELLGVPAAQALALQWRLVNTGVSKIVLAHSGPSAVSLNEHAHLEGASRRLLTYR